MFSIRPGLNFGRGTMIVGELALTTAAFFSGAAVYVSAAEQPARLELDDKDLLAEWKRSYKLGAAQQAPLVFIGALLGCLAWWQMGDWRWLLGAAALISAWPYTGFVIMPTNDRLDAIGLEHAGPESRALIKKWGRMHLVQAGQGIAATLCFLWASA